MIALIYSSVLNEKTLSGRSCKANRRASKQYHSRRESRANAHSKMKGGSPVTEIRSTHVKIVNFSENLKKNFRRLAKPLAKKQK